MIISFFSIQTAMYDCILIALIVAQILYVDFTILALACRSAFVVWLIVDPRLPHIFGETKVDHSFGGLFFDL